MIDDHNDGDSPPPLLPLDRDERFEALEQLAATDPMTGLSNRRGCEKSIAAEMTRAERERRPLSIVLFDIDRLRDVNATRGYMAGDQVLREVGSILRRAVRPDDIVARWAGDEFLVVLPGVDQEQSLHIAARIRRAVRAQTDSTHRVTVSSGVSECDSDFDFAATVRAAYQRLNQAKRSGEEDSDPHAAVREPHPRHPRGTDRSSAASVEEPEPDRRVDAVRRSGWPST